jgi:hypothetical protein
MILSFFNLSVLLHALRSQSMDAAISADHKPWPQYSPLISFPFAIKELCRSI